MAAKNQYFLVFFGFLIASCGDGTNDAKMSTTAELPVVVVNEVEATCLRTIRLYVGKTRGWDENSYNVIAELASRGEKGFSVRHNDDLRSLFPEGGRKSFHVDLDRACNEVLRELNYQ